MITISQRNIGRKLLVSVRLLAMAAALPVTTEAQTPVQTADASTGLEEITVTARKRSETVLNVPISVSAFDGTTIESRGIASINDIAALTPGFNINNNQSSRNDRSNQLLIVRGMTPVSSQLSTASVFIDGAPVTSGFVDGIDAVDRVEVLKGPQSAYFGRSTFSGALNIVTKKPSDTLKLGIDALGGTNNWFDVRLTGEGPIVSDKLSMRLSLRDYAMTGMYGNNGDKGGTLGDQSTKSANLALYATPIDDLKVSVFGDVWHDSDGPGATGVLLAKDYNCNAGAGKGVNNYICGQLPQIATSRLAADTLIDRIYTSLINNPGRTVEDGSEATNHGGLQRNAYHLHAAIDYALPDLGITLSSLTAANYDHQSVLQDLDNQASLGIPNANYKGAATPFVEPFSNWIFLIGKSQDDVSQEFRIASDQNNAFRWTIGGNFTHSLTKSSLASNSPFGPGTTSRPAPLDTDTYAIFGGLNYDIFDDVTISFDARYQLDHQANYTEQVTGPDLFVGTVNFRTFSPRVIVQYKFTPDIMLYASWSIGNNVGGLLNSAVNQLTPYQKTQVNAQFPSIAASVAPEETEQYEVGIKGRFWDNRITLSTDLYAGTWTDQIINFPIIYPLSPTSPQVNTISVYGNIGKTDLFGWEFDGKIKPIDHLVISGAAGMAGTDIRTFICQPCVAITGSKNVQGNQIQNYPKWQANIGAEWSDDLPNWEGWSYFARGDAIYRDIMFVDFTNKAWTPASTRFNFRLGIASENYSIEAFVLNAFNDKGYVSAIASQDLLSPGFSANAIPVGLPLLRQVGVRLKYNFDAGGSSSDYTPPPAPMPPPPTPTPAPVAAAPETSRSFQVFFDFDKADITAAAMQVIEAAANAVKSGHVVQITVTGHTDTVGSNAYNQVLSERRAAAVKVALVADGVGSNEITTAGVGKAGLLVSTGDGVREPQNRRAEIVLG